MIRLLCLVLALFAFSAPSLAAEKLEVVATFSIIGDIAGRIAGDNADLTTLVGPDADAHAFEPTPAHARKVAQAGIVLVNGLGFEPWIDRLVKSSGSTAKIVVVSEGVKPIRSGDASDPHAWQDVRNAKLYTENITRALVAADQANGRSYKANTGAYLAELAKLDEDIRAAIALVPRERRKVITTHDAFGYFAKAYSVAFIAPLGTSTEQQASAKAVAALISQIKREKIGAVFVENISDPRLIEQVARETGAKLGGKLYSDALSTKADPAPTYIALMRHNAKLLTEAMGRGL